MSTQPFTCLIPINPQAWNTPPFYSGRRNGKLWTGAGRDQENENFKEAVKEILTERGAHMIDPPYYISLALWRNVEKGRKEVDLTNMQKLIEDALHEVIIDNDVNTIEFHTRRVEQKPDGPEFFVLSVHHVEPWDDMAQESILLQYGKEVWREGRDLLAGKSQQPAATQDNSWPPK